MARTHWPALLLVAITALIYAPVAGFDAINYDDPHFLFENPNLHRGINAQTLRWAVTDTDGNYWHPVGNLVNLLAFTALPPTPGAQHVVNAALLMAMAGGLYWVLFITTQRRALAFVAAALWAWHPLRVESAAWLTERVGLVCGLFAIAAVGAYVAYARRRGVWRYVVVALLFCLAMMAKPVLPALPVALLALDVWPLNRVEPMWRQRRWRGVLRLVLEKLPLLAIALAFAAMTARMVAAAAPGQQDASVSASWTDAVFAVPAALGWMLFKTFVPTGLAIDYPWVTAWSRGQSVAALLGLIALTLLILRSRHKSLIAGWIWFVVMLVPMLAASRYRTTWVADRYALVPHMLLMAAIACAALDATSAQRRAGGSTFLRRWGAITVALGGLVVLSARQVWRWQDSQTLFRHAIAVAPQSEVSHHNLGVALMEQGRLVEAGDHFTHAAGLAPRYTEPRVNLGIVWERLGNFPLAERSLLEALQMQPGNRRARFALARLRARQGRSAEAVTLYEQLARDHPGDVDVRVNYGAAMEIMGNRAGAEAQYREALRLDPNDPDARANLDDLLAGRSRTTASQPS